MLKPSSELNKVVDDLSQGLWSLKYLLVVSAGLCALQSLVPALCPFGLCVPGVVWAYCGGEPLSSRSRPSSP